MRNNVDECDSHNITSTIIKSPQQQYFQASGSLSLLKFLINSRARAVRRAAFDNFIPLVFLRALLLIKHCRCGWTSSSSTPQHHLLCITSSPHLYHLLTITSPLLPPRRRNSLGSFERSDHLSFF